MQRLKSALVWLGRIGHCRGFGVQSPTDYRFVRYVINEHFPYYKYKDLADEMPDVKGTERKLCRLYFRLSNYCQASSFIDFMPSADSYGRYVSAACQATSHVVVRTGELPPLEDGETFLARLDCVDSLLPIANFLLDKATEKSVIAVQGIKESKSAKRLWRQLADDNRVSVAYDLYYCGIIIADKRRYKKKYIINF